MRLSLLDIHLRLADYTTVNKVTGTVNNTKDKLGYPKKFEKQNYICPDISHAKWCMKPDIFPQKARDLILTNTGL